MVTQKPDAGETSRPSSISESNDSWSKTAGLPLYHATTLTQGGRTAHIRLGEQLYTLRITRAEKLILTK